MSIRFLHTADAHFGVENYGRIDPSTGLHTRLLDFKKSFEYMVDYAILHDLDVFVFAGDAYKNSYPSPTHQRILIKLFLKLLNHGIPVVIVVGNHDHPGSQIKAHALDIFYHIKHPLCFIFSRIGQVRIPLKQGRAIDVVGFPWPFPILFSNDNKVSASFTTEEVCKRLDAMKTKIIGDAPAILVGHCMMQEGSFSGSEKPILEGKDPVFKSEQIYDDIFSYVALGHLHKAQYINKKKENQSPIVYSGSPDRIDFGEEKDTKVFSLVEIDDKKKASFEFIPIPTCRPFYTITIHITSIDTIEEDIEKKLSQYERLSEAIVRIRYSYDYEYIKYVNVSRLKKMVSSVWCVASIECINKYKSRNKKISEGRVYEEKKIENLVFTYVKHNNYFVDELPLYLAEIEKYRDFFE
jgi:exonuclease SbcD